MPNLLCQMRFNLPFSLEKEAAVRWPTPRHGRLALDAHRRHHHPHHSRCGVHLPAGAQFGLQREIGASLPLHRVGGHTTIQHRRRRRLSANDAGEGATTMAVVRKTKRRRWRRRHCAVVVGVLQQKRRTASISVSECVC